MHDPFTSPRRTAEPTAGACAGRRSSRTIMYVRRAAGDQTPPPSTFSADVRPAGWLGGRLAQELRLPHRLRPRGAAPNGMTSSHSRRSSRASRQGKGLAPRCGTLRGSPTVRGRASLRARGQPREERLQEAAALPTPRASSGRCMSRAPLGAACAPLPGSPTRHVGPGFHRIEHLVCRIGLTRFERAGVEFR